MHVDSYRLMSPADAQEIVNAIKGLDWKAGQAKSPEATAAVKHNLELRSEDGDVPEALLDGILTRLNGCKAIHDDHFVAKILRPKFNRYTGGGTYQRHGDSAIMATMVRTDIACTIFLSHPETYEGGDLCIENPAGGYSKIRGAAGTCVVYPCHWPHWVEPVTEGERISAITWIESLVRDVERRQILRRFHRTLRELEADERFAWGQHHTSLATICGFLVRAWMEPLQPQGRFDPRKSKPRPAEGREAA